MKVRFTRQARRDIDAVYDFIARDNPDAAQRTLDRIKHMVATLPDHPRMGRPGRNEGTREFVVPGLPYIVAYRNTPTSVDIVSIIHAARRWPDDF